MGWAVLSSAEMRLKAKIEEAGIPLKDWDVNIYRGILTGFNEAFIINEQTKNKLISECPESADIIHPILRGRDVKRYIAQFGERWIINTHNGIDSKEIIRINVEFEYPGIYKYLNQKKFKPTIEVRGDKGFHWTNLRNCAYFDEFKNDKIVWLEITDEPKFCYDDKGTFVEATAFFLTGKPLHYLLCVLNSKVSRWYLDKITASTGAGTNRWKKVYLEKIPIPKISEIEENKFVELCNNLFSKKENGESIKLLEDEIDKIIFEKYNLTTKDTETLLKLS